MKNSDINFVFFGTPEIASTILDSLEAQQLVPRLVVTSPDRPAGRGLKTTPTPVKQWAQNHSVPLLQPEKLRTDSFVEALNRDAPKSGWDVFVVVAYGKIIPPEVLAIPKNGSLNVHFSLLPKLRGPAPVEAQILADDSATGVTIMLLDEEMDHGPLLAQTQIEPDGWPVTATLLKEILSEEGGTLLSHVLPLWVSGKVEPFGQDHDKATYCHFLNKQDAQIDLGHDPYQNFLKIRAYSDWPRAFFYTERKGKRIRVTVTDASYDDGVLTITRVIPEGKKEMKYSDFLAGS